MNAPDQDIVTIFPAKKSPAGDAVILKFQTRSGEVLRLSVSDAIARNLGTQLLLLSTGYGRLCAVQNRFKLLIAARRRAALALALD